MPLKVALYYPWIYLTGGAERLIVELTGRSRHDWTIYTNHFRPNDTFSQFSQRRVVALEEVPVSRTLGATARAARTIFTQRVDLSRYDALLIVCEGFGDLMNFDNPRVPKVCCCLTPLRVAFDSAYLTSLLKDASLFQRLAVKTGGILFRAVDRLAWKKYDSITFISAEAARRAVAGKLLKPEQVKVVHPGIGFAPEWSDVREPYFLLPGRIMWTKNIELGIRAFLEMRRRCSELAHFRLVIAGAVNDKSGEYFAFLDDLREGSQAVQFRLAPSDAELKDLYRRCYAVLFTAFNEDWGIVPLESMAFGKAVIAVNRGGPRESIRHGVEGFLEEPEPCAFAERMADLGRSPDLARSLGMAGFDRAQDFTWDLFVERLDRELLATHLAHASTDAARTEALT